MQLWLFTGRSSTTRYELKARWLESQIKSQMFTFKLARAIARLAPLPHRKAKSSAVEKNLETRARELNAFHGNRRIKRPEHWGGYRLQPSQIEFWKGRPSRLHDRILYERQPDGDWRIQRLAP